MSQLFRLAFVVVINFVDNSYDSGDDDDDDDGNSTRMQTKQYLNNSASLRPIYWDKNRLDPLRKNPKQQSKKLTLQ